MKLKAIKQKHQETSRSTENAEKPEIVYDGEALAARDTSDLQKCRRYLSFFSFFFSKFFSKQGDRSSTSIVNII